MLALNPPPLPYKNRWLLPNTLNGTNPLGGCKIHSNSISRSNLVFYVSIKGGVCVCVYTWDRGFLVSHVSLGVRKMGWLHENHWAVGALLGGGLLESAADGGGLLKLKQMFQLAVCRVCLLAALVATFMAGWLAWWVVGFLVERLATPLVGWLVVYLATLFTLQEKSLLARLKCSRKNSNIVAKGY